MDLKDYEAKVKDLGYSQSSAELFARTIQSFLTKNYPKNKTILEKPLGRIRKLFLLPNLNTRRNTAKAVMLYQKVNDLDSYEKSNKYYQKLYKKSMKARDETKREPVDTTKFDTIAKDLETKYNEAIDSNDMQQVLQYLPTIILMRLMTEYPTRRAQDYRELRMKKPRENAKTSNYYSRGKLYFNSFKGKDMADVSLFRQQPITKFFKKSKDGVVIEVDEELKDLFNMLRKLDRSRTYLMEDGRKQYSQPAFSQWVRRTFGMPVNEFRKMYVQKNVDSKAIDKAKSVAEGMSNSVTTQQRDYRDRT